MPRSSPQRRRRTLTGVSPMSSRRRDNVSSLLAASVVTVLSLGTLVNPVDCTGSVITQRALGVTPDESLRDSIPISAAAAAGALDDEAGGGNASGIAAAGEGGAPRRRLQSMAAVAADAAPAAAEAAGGGGGAASAGKLADRGFAAFDSDHNGAIDRTEYDRGVEKLVAFLEAPLPPPPAKAKAGSKGFAMPSLFSAFAGDDTDETHFWPAFVSSAGMIIATEIGDKTFFIAAVLSMRNDRGAVFLGALFALVCMTVLSTMMGLILPSILPRQYTSMFGAFLFLYFGVRLINDSRGMSHRVSEELEEVEEELLQGHHHNKKSEDKKVVSKTPSDLEAANGGPDHKLKTKESELSTGSAFGATSHSWEKVFVQSLTLTFLAEWGDRSQIATIALAAHKDPYGVTFGGCLGHSLCTGVAVVGGRMLASRISEKTVSLAGGIIFLVFGVHSLFFE